MAPTQNSTTPSLTDGHRPAPPKLLQKLYYAYYRLWLSNPRRLAARAKSSPKRVVIGCSGEFEAGWIPTDADHLNLVQPETWKRFFSESSIDRLLAEHVWEHLTPEDARTAARTCFQFLKPGGTLRVAVPDGLHPDAEYVRHVDVGGTGLGSDDHKVLYTHETLRDVFTSVGFDVTPLEHFERDGSFYAKPWDPKEGLIYRSRQFDQRNADGILRYTSIILDAHRPS